MLDFNVIDAGWSSRCIFVWAEEERFKTFYIRDFTDEQKQAYIDILEHLKKLSRVFGRINYSPEVLEYLTDYFTSNHTYRNPEPNLEPYYKRKNIHVPKLALAAHFADIEIEWKDGKPFYDDTLKLKHVKIAVDLLERLEHNMHLALCVGKKNPAAELSDKILDYMRHSHESAEEKTLLIRFWNEMPDGLNTYRAAVDHLISVRKIKVSDNKQLAYELL